MRKKDGAEGIMLPNFRLYYKATITKTVWYWHKNRNVDQWYRIVSPEKNWCTFGHLIYEKGGKNMQFKKSLVHNWCRENWEGACKRMRRIFCISLNLKICLCLYLLCIYYLHVYKWVHICVYTCACVLLKCYLFFLP